MIPYLFYGVYDGGAPLYVISDNSGALYSGTSDNCLVESTPTTNFGAASTFSVKAWNTSDRAHTLLKFDGLSSVPIGTVANAKIRIYCETVSANNPTVQLYGLRQAFNELQSTWNQAQTGTNWTAAGAIDNSADIFGTLLGSVVVNAQERYFEISSPTLNVIIQSILAGDPNHGFLLTEANYLTPAGQFKEAVFTSSEGANSQRPILIFDWAGSGASGFVKVYLSSSWQLKPVKVWNGTAWVTKPAKVWNGSAWIDS